MALRRGRLHAAAAEAGFVPIIGRVGANPEGLGAVARARSPATWPRSRPRHDRARALLVVGHSMRRHRRRRRADLFEDQRTAVTPDMLGHVVVVEVDTDEVLVKRLLRGSRPGRYDLESIAGPTRQDARLRWAAHITRSSHPSSPAGSSAAAPEARIIY